MLPKFKYHPYCLENKVFKKAKKNEEIICMCCNQYTEYYYDKVIYAIEDVNCLCPQCVADGTAAKKYNATFIQDAEEIENDEHKTTELFERTPGLITWQGEHWLACCNDYCAFMAYAGTEELEKMGIAEEVFADYATQDEYEIEDVRPYLEKDGSMVGYLFQCLHCGKYRIWVDAD